jgi:hypothetical protein
MFRGDNMVFEKKKTDNFMLYIPVKNRNNWLQRDNVIYISFKYDRPVEKLVAWLTGKHTIRDIKLDKLGTSVWRLLDGKNNVHKIGQILLKEYGDGCQPVYERLIVYLRYLNRKGWIKFKTSKDLNSFSITKA